MENPEEDLGETVTTTTPDLDVEIMAPLQTLPPAQHPDLNESVEIIENPIEVLDLTSPPQPSSSSSTSNTTNSSSNSAGAVGSSSLAVKRNLEEALKDTNLGAGGDASALDQNPSTSSSTSTAACTSSSSSNVLECPICLQTCIHPARLPCGHIFCFLCVKGVAYKNRRCAMCRREIPPEFLDHPQLVNGIEDICTTKATDDGYQWFYEGRNGGWWAYEKRNADEIEEAFQNLFNKRLYPRPTKTKPVKKEKQDKGTELEDSDEESNKEVDDDENDFDSESTDTDEEGEEFDKIKLPDSKDFTYNIQICGNMYTVDFQNMVQYPFYMPHRKRKICRAKGLPAKGVAGLLAKKKHRRMKPY